MGYFDKLAELGFMVVCRRNQLNTTTMFAVRESDSLCSQDDFDDVLLWLPEWRTVDFVGDDAAKGAKMLYEKLTLQGDYATWDERLLKHEGGHAAHGGPISENMLDFLIGFEHRPESERFQPVDDTPAPPPELVEDLNLSEGGG